MPHQVCGPAVLGATLNQMLKRPIQSSHTVHSNNIANLDNYIIRFIPYRYFLKYIRMKYESYLFDYAKTGSVRYGTTLSKPTFFTPYAKKIKEQLYQDSDFQPKNDTYIC